MSREIISPTASARPVRKMIGPNVVPFGSNTSVQASATTALSQMFSSWMLKSKLPPEPGMKMGGDAGVNVISTAGAW